MDIKTYEIFSTAKKTASVNKLIMISNNMLFNFDLLNDMDISETEKNIIIQDIEHVMFSNKISYYGTMFDQFTACDGIAKYDVQKVYSKKTGKLLYGIFTLAKIKHYSKNRSSIYDNYDVVEIIKDYGYKENSIDIEI